MNKHTTSLVCTCPECSQRSRCRGSPVIVHTPSHDVAQGAVHNPVGVDMWCRGSPVIVHTPSHDVAQGAIHNPVGVDMWTVSQHNLGIMQKVWEPE